MPSSNSKKPIGRFMFLLWVVVVAALWGSLSHFRPRSDGGFASFIAVAGVATLAMLWMQAVEGRLLDAGLPLWCRWPYVLILSFGCILLHSFKVLDGPQALALFILVQVPTVFIKSRSTSPNLP